MLALVEESIVKDIYNFMDIYTFLINIYKPDMDSIENYGYQCGKVR